MKKFIVFVLFACLLSTVAKAQTQKHVIGLRITPAPAFYGGSSLLYQYGLSPSSRLSFGLNISGGSNYLKGYNSFKSKFSAYYQHVWNIKGGLNWYLGFGAQFEYSRFESPGFLTVNSYLGVGPQIGLEYDFNKHNVPLILGVDYRPSYGLGTFNFGSPSIRHNVGLSLRYRLK